MGGNYSRRHSMPESSVRPPNRLYDTVAAGLTAARRRTLTLNEFDDAQLTRQHSPLMSPLVWDLAHVGQQEDLWLLRGGVADRPGVLPPDADRLYDAFRSTRAERAGMPLLSPRAARNFIADVRGRALDRLSAIPDPAARRSSSRTPWSSSTSSSTSRRCMPPISSAWARRCSDLGSRCHPAAAVERDSGRRGAVPAGEFVARGRRQLRTVVAGQRAAGSRRRPAGFSDRLGRR